MFLHSSSINKESDRKNDISQLLTLVLSRVKQTLDLFGRYKTDGHNFSMAIK